MCSWRRLTRRLGVFAALAAWRGALIALTLGVVAIIADRMHVMSALRLEGLQRRDIHRDVSGSAYFGNKNVGLSKAENIALAQPPRDEPRATHAELQEDVTPVAREARCAAARTMLVDNRVKPEGIVVTLVSM